MSLRINIISFLVLFFSLSLYSADKEYALFGAKLFIEADAKQIKKIDQFVTSKLNYYQGAFDPDCYYKEYGNKLCGTEKLPESFNKLVSDIEKETNGKFQLLTTKDKNGKRDYGGIAQGAVLQEIATNFSEGWAGNFAGDIFIAPPQKGKTLKNSKLSITDPSDPLVAYAAVEMESGWVMGSTSSKWGGKSRQDKDLKFDYDKVVLFAKPSFNGARLDAWATALIQGGDEIMRKLLSLEEYKGQWAFLYFDPEGKAHCSSNIVCKLDDPKNAKIQIKW